MQRMKFLKISLLSQKEQRGLQLNLNYDSIVMAAGNGFGKSAILKSLYDTLGANPHKIDRSWRDAKVTCLVEFSIDSQQFAVMKNGKTFTVYDDAKNVLLNTHQIVASLGPRMADLLDFRLILSDKKEQITVPPPSFAFAPYYVDQDSSWQRVWASFRDLGMFTNGAKSLAEYHSGLRPNSYYKAKAARDAIRVQLTALDAERKALHHALQKIRESIQGAPLALTLADFTYETDRLVLEGQRLHTEQARYRNELGILNDEHQLWSDHVSLIEASLRENEKVFEEALKLPSDVECPLCGQHYHNEIADQFEMVADTDDLIAALQAGRSQLRDVHERLSAHRAKIQNVENSLSSMNEALSVHREDISLRDVVAAEGRAEAERYLKDRLNELDADYGDKSRAIDVNEKLMKQSDSAAHRNEIQGYFSKRLKLFAERLDVRLDDPEKLSLQGLNIGRGSEGPRALAAYYYAFLHTASTYSTATFCPIVIDAPNQQGQDPAHLKAIMSFLLAEAPPNAQVIIGAEFPPDEPGAEILDISNQKDRVLRAEEFSSVSAYLRPFIEQSLMI